MTADYLHGYDRDEQAKLDRNAELSYDVTKNFLKIQDTSKFKMIEIGCGTGYTLYRLAKQIDGITRSIDWHSIIPKNFRLMDKLGHG